MLDSEKISFFFLLSDIQREVLVSEPERGKIQPDHAVDIQHPPGVIPWTYTKAFQECSREVFCGKDQTMSRSHVGRSCPTSILPFLIQLSTYFPMGPKRIPIPYIGNMYIDVFPMNFISPAAKPSTEVKRISSPHPVRPQSMKFLDPRFPSAAGSFSHCNFLIFVFLIPSVHETSICDSLIRYAAFSTVLFSTFIFPVHALESQDQPFTLYILIFSQIILIIDRRELLIHVFSVKTKRSAQLVHVRVIVPQLCVDVA